MENSKASSLQQQQPPPPQQQQQGRPACAQGSGSSSQGMRRSCDRCGKHKKGCDREWPCRRCLGSGNQCTYSKRQGWPGDQQQQQQHQHQHQHEQARPAGVHATNVQLRSPSGALLACGMVSLMRGEGCVETSAASNPRQQQGGPAYGTGTADGGGRRPYIPKMRRSCDRCGEHKKGCDGVWPCSRCLVYGNKCTYSKRRSPHPPQQQRQQQQQQQQQRQQQKHTRPAGAHPKKVLPHPSSGAVLAYGVVSIKRCRLSASPATGLVGMRENTFISDFFGCIGFLPLATQSQIREAMVKMLSCPPAVGQPPPQALPARGGPFDQLVPRGGLNASSVGGRQFPKDLSTCVFWSSVGLGALVKGNPVESVAQYSRLARDALESYRGPANTEVARAWTILAYLYLFCGDLVMFQEYTALSEAFLRTSTEQGLTEMLPVGFAEIVHYRVAVKVSCGDIDDKVASVFAHERAPPQLTEAPLESELYPFVLRWWESIASVVYSAEFSERTIAGGHHRLRHFEPRSEAEEADRRLSGASAGFLDTLTRKLKECASEFGRIEETVDRADFRDGIGGLLINGTLVFEKAFKGDFPGTLARITRCVEVFEKFPGVCRFEMGVHAAHSAVTVLTAMGGPRARELYETVRRAYNLACLPGAAPLPRFEGWQGISRYCDLGQCRAMERVILSGEMSGFWVRTNASSSGFGQEPGGARANGATGARRIAAVGGQANRPPLSAGITSEERFPWVPASSRFKPGFDQPVASSQANFGSSLLLHGGGERRTATLVAPEPRFPHISIGETHNAHRCGGDGIEATSRGTRGSVVAQPPGPPLPEPGSREWAGRTDVVRKKDEPAVEDWLEVAEALFGGVTDP